MTPGQTHTQIDTRPRVGSALPTGPHEHAWQVESGHQTSAGRVLYVRCAGCGARRVDLQAHPLLPPDALSIAVAAG